MYSRSLLLWLALFTGVAHAASPFAPAPILPDYPDFTYCDAQLLAGLWGVEVEQAKARAGRELLPAGSPQLEAELQQARRQLADQAQSLCSLPMHNIRSTQAEQLAELWQMSAEQAKARASRKLFHGDAAVVYSALARAQERTPHAQLTEQGAWALWYDAGYRFCDAMLLANSWGGEPWEAKVRGGRMLAQAGGDAQLREELAGAARAATAAGVECSAASGDVGYGDAVYLAELWGLPGPSEAKAAAVAKLSRGEGPDIQRALDPYRQGHFDGEGEETADLQPDVDVFEASEYNACDAQLLAQSWEVSEREARATIGYKLRHDYHDQLPALLQGARDSLLSKGAIPRCSAEDSGISVEDLGRLAVYWNTSEDGSRLRAERMLFNGERAELKRAVLASKSKKKRRRCSLRRR